MLEVGSWKLEVGSWKLEVGSWKLEVGSWKLEVGSWKLDVGRWTVEVFVHFPLKGEPDGSPGSSVATTRGLPVRVESSQVCDAELGHDLPAAIRRTQCKRKRVKKLRERGLRWFFSSGLAAGWS